MTGQDAFKKALEAFRAAGDIDAAIELRGCWGHLGFIAYMVRSGEIDPDTQQEYLMENDEAIDVLGEMIDTARKVLGLESITRERAVE